MTGHKEKDSSPYPLPAGEGQLDTPINQLKQGEVMTRIEKTVFISYRRTNKPWALFVYQNLTMHGYDVFFDYLKVTNVKSPIISTSDYYPFGLETSNSCSRENSVKQDYKYNDKERQDELDLGGLDYGARMYDNQIGRWYVVDNYSETYYGLSPYNYGGDNPVNTIDVDGNLFIFANGFMKDHWKGGTNKTVEYRYKADPGVTYTVPNPDYYNPDRGFYSDGPRNNGQVFDYWEGVDAAYMNVYKDENAYYTNGSFTPGASARARFNEGLKAGAI